MIRPSDVGSAPNPSQFMLEQDPACLVGPRASPPHDSIVAALESAAQCDMPLFTFHGRQEYTLRTVQLLDDARRWGAALETVGVRRGHPVLILLPTSEDFVGAMLGAMWIGALPTPLASPMTFGSVDRFLQSLGHIIEDSGARVVVTTPRMRDGLSRMPASQERLRSVLVPSDADTLARAQGISLGARDGALLQYTSGTTGRPKGVLISHGALTTNAFAIRDGLGLSDSDVGVSWLPMFHDMGLIGVVLSAVAHPYPVHLIPPEAFVMRPERWLRLIAEVGGTVSAAPNFAYQFCVSKARQFEGRLDSWRLALNGAEQVHQTTIERFSERFKEKGFDRRAMLPVYGMAENTLAVTFAPFGAGATSLRVDRTLLERDGVVIAMDKGGYDAVSLGAPVAGTSVRIRHDEGGLVGSGIVGEIEIGGSSLMDGYYGRDEDTHAALRDGWLRSGDLGFIYGDELYVVGRRKEVVIKGGRNIYPADVECVVAEHPGAFASAAFARPDIESGTDQLVLMIETRLREPEARMSLAKSVLGEVLAALSVKVDEIRFAPVGSLPRTTSGKLQRSRCAVLMEPTLMDPGS